MGRNKALLTSGGVPLIEKVYRTLSAIFAEVVVVTNTPEEYAFLPCPKIPDRYVGMGSMAGVHAGLSWSRTEWVFVAACDMPYLDASLIRNLAARLKDGVALVPETDAGMEPLHSFYSQKALPYLEEALTGGRQKLLDLLESAGAERVPAPEIARLSPGFKSFANVNTPEDYHRLTP